MRPAFTRLSSLTKEFSFEKRMAMRQALGRKFRPRLELLEDRTLLSPSNLILSVNPSAISENGTTTLSGSFSDPGPVLADSVNDFSLTQGQANWYYGYYTTPGDSTTFTQMAFTSPNFGGFAGPAWEESQTQPPWTAIWAGGAHPNGSNDGPIHWAVRRWISTITGTVSITGTIGDAGSTGDGIGGSIYVNGTQVYTQFAAAQSQAGYSVSVNVTAGSPVDLAVDPGPNGNDQNDHAIFTATISQLPSHTVAIAWGDSQTTTLNLAPSVLSFSGVTHQYLEEQSGSTPYVIAATVTNSNNQSTSATTSVSVADAALADTTPVSTIKATEGNSTGQQILASFTDANAGASPSDFTPSVNWGGTLVGTPTVSVQEVSSSASSSTWQVLGTATYAEEGTYAVSVSVTDVGGQSVSTSNTSFGVADAALTAGTASASGTEGATASLTATFSDANLGAPASEFTAVITWGDGGPTSTGTVSGSGGSYSVAGSHVYAEEGTYNLSIAVTGAGGSMTTITGTATVGDAALTAGTASASGTEGATANLAGTFSDGNLGAAAGEFTAVITWGDGGPTSTGTVSGSGGSYSVAGSHVYAEEGTYNLSIAVTDAGGSTATITGTATVGDAALTAGAASAGGMAGASSSLLGTFSDANLSAPAGEFTAVITWGDGGPTSTGTESGVGGSYSIAGSHIYSRAGSYNLSIAVVDAGSSTTTVTGVATVAGAILTPGTASASGAEGLPSSLVGTFSDSNLGAVASDFTAVITWGDGGPTSTGTVTSTGAGNFSVSGSHNYTEEGTYNVSILVTDSGGSAATIAGTATVADAALTAGGAAAITENQGLPFTNIPLAIFTDANPGGTVSDFTATIDWGDGTPAGTGSISQSGTTFVVQGSHVYSTPGSKSGTVTITDVGGQTTTANYSATIVESVFVLDPTPYDALTLTDQSHVNVSGSVLVNSDASRALSASDQASVTASSIQLVGGYQLSDQATLSPAPVTVAEVQDPLSGLMPPSVSGLPVYGEVAFNQGAHTLNPGVYREIKAYGCASLTLKPGTYIIEGSGLKVMDYASLSGTGVLIYNAGSNYPNPGGNFGPIRVSDNGTINLSAATTGTYAGVAIFQARDNILDLSLSDCARAGITGVVYAESARLLLSGQAELHAPLVVGMLNLSNCAALDGDNPNEPLDTAIKLLAGNLSTDVNDLTAPFIEDELARILDAANELETLLAPYQVAITEIDPVPCSQGAASQIGSEIESAYRPASGLAQPWLDSLLTGQELN